MSYPIYVGQDASTDDIYASSQTVPPVYSAANIPKFLPLLDPVQNLTLSAISATSITATWSAVTGATSYLVKANGVSFSTTSSTYVLINLTQNTTYNVSVTANFSSGKSAPVSKSQKTGFLRVMLFAGQSNMQGIGNSYDAGLDTTHPNILQYSIGDQYSQNKTQQNTFQPAKEPLNDGYNTTAIGPCLAFGRSWMAANPTDTLILVNVGVSSAAFMNNSLNWTVPNGNIFQRALNAMTKVDQQYPQATLIGIGWIQGESDVNGGAVLYRSKLMQLFQTFRQFPKANSTTPICLISMVPEWTNANQIRIDIQNVHRLVPNTVPYTSFVFGPSNSSNPGDQIHYSAAGQRLNGGLLYTSLAVANANTKPIPTNLKFVSSTKDEIKFTYDGYGTSFNVFYQTGADPPQTFTTTDTTIALRFLQQGTTYSITMSANSANGTSALSSALSATTADSNPTVSLSSKELTPDENITTWTSNGHTFTSNSTDILVTKVYGVNTLNFAAGKRMYCPTLSFGNQFSVMMLFYYPVEVTTALCNFFSTRRTTPPDFCSLFTDATGKLQMFNNNTITATSQKPAASEWYLVTCVFDQPNNTTRLVMNSNSFGIVETVGPCASLFTNTGFMLNGYGTDIALTGGSFRFNCSHVDVWPNYALNNTEIETRMQELTTLYGI